MSRSSFTGGRRVQRSVYLFAAVVGFLITSFTPPARADEMLGSTEANNGCLPNYFIVQEISGATNYAIPLAGTITSWSFSAGAIPNTQGLVVLRRNGVTNTYTVVGSATAQTVAANSTGTFNVAIPVLPGDMFGPWVGEAGSDHCNRSWTGGGAIIGTTATTLPDAGSVVGPVSGTFGRDVNMRVSVAYQLGAPSLIYKPLAPCRIMDTRSATAISAQGPILGNRVYTIPGSITAGQNWGQYGGASTSDCGLTKPPGGSINAVAIVASILNPNYDAYLGISEVQDLYTVLSNVALNFTAGQGLSTTYLAPQIFNNNEIHFAIPEGVSAQLIFDVVGYLVFADATPLQCTTQASVPVAIGGGTSGTATSPTCSAGYTLTSGSCGSASTSISLTQDKATGSNLAWLCAATNNGGASADLTATATCCGVPGK